MAKHHFYLQADWPGKRNDIGRIESGNLKTEISIPKEMDGPGAGTNPDEMLLGAAATCYIITLAAMMERSGLEKESLTMESEAVVDVTGGVFTYEKIIHRPLIRLPKEAAEKEVQLAERLAEKAETSCMISRAVQGNVAIELEPKIVVSKAD
ncbi:OsmC family protein [Bacillus sp. GM2]|uniref:OsmC family protein n=1 Tax=Bacillus TaxID=1386 RepID=UPI000951F9FE|nr:OsmC family protein [Bacillus paralicheniformis]MSO00760.1 SACOL1771 family peroxiredoxin [Bacillus paralicheniformis]MSO04768.1 SACOL1771 family peroxiredoxin [Bacillus paralicheniformis]MSO08761.1 SACOL1771 family peroxiredoxin [Bacillus paralicheniformis]MSO12755.1 SACOL1771 family peroxiredoxin [Bacillus paralicheniformis]NJE39253.1 OsmC family peroxiredoxin [Bacillus paralicheniformis]